MGKKIKISFFTSSKKDRKKTIEKPNKSFPLLNIMSRDLSTKVEVESWNFQKWSNISYDPVEKGHYYSLGHFVVFVVFDVDAKYVKIKLIGVRRYGVVCSFLNTETNEKVAIEKRNRLLYNPINALRTLRELKFLRHLQHENIIVVKDILMPSSTSRFDKSLYLVYELMDTDLHRIIKSSLPLSNDHCRYFLFQILRVLKYLHSANICHGDLNPEILLVNANRNLKICSFGLACTGNVKYYLMDGFFLNACYQAPELLLLCDKYDTSIDIWSVGCIFAELLRRKPLFAIHPLLADPQHRTEQLKLIARFFGEIKDADLDFIDNQTRRSYFKSLLYTQGIPLRQTLGSDVDPLAFDLLQRMLVFNPSKRISVNEALQHPYMKSLYDPRDNRRAQLPSDFDMIEETDENVIRQLISEEIISFGCPKADSSLLKVDEVLYDNDGMLSKIVMDSHLTTSRRRRLPRSRELFY